jgi:hypothetical protein
LQVLFIYKDISISKSMGGIILCTAIKNIRGDYFDRARSGRS